MWVLQFLSCGTTPLTPSYQSPGVSRANHDASICSLIQKHVAKKVVSVTGIDRNWFVSHYSDGVNASQQQ